MRYVIIGNGIAGQTAAETLRKEDPESDILIITDEAYPYYTRIWLPPYLAGLRTLEKVLVRQPEWYQKQKISLILNAKVEEIKPNEHEIIINGEDSTIHYDKLLLATGARPRFIDFGRSNLKGMFTLRNIADVHKIRNYLNSEEVNKILVIGGGLLGIELAYNLKELGKKVQICEIAQYLLPRQLDRESSMLLTRYLETKGVEITCGQAIKEILGDEKVSGVMLEDGTSIKCEMIMEQMGIIPNIRLAQKAGLSVNRGIIINKYMETSGKNIFAAGDCIEFNGRIWGIIPASREQGKLAAKNMINEKSLEYKGTFWTTRLKIAGIKLTCLGVPPKEDAIQKSGKIIQAVHEDEFICRKVLIDNGKLQGAVLLGNGNDRFFVKNIGKEVSETELEEKIKIE